ncbi:MAG: GGDEF domain-containing protein [Epsilonproteobacteria bacterium]|nr:GGDEF domain-containing protein [Campylobacterota bacterium]
MNEINLAIIIVLVFIILLLLYLLKTNKNSIKSFLDKQTNIIVLTTNSRVTFINKAGLKFFGFENIKEFIEKYNNLPNLFIEGDGCFSKHSVGKKWLTNIYKEKKEIKVKLKTPKDHNLEYYFLIQISEIKNGLYLLSFTNITRLESDKDMIRKLADYDALTNIYSRVKFNEIFPIYLERRDRYNETFSIILFDIDHFKLINDNQGHNIGDKVLIELTSIVKQKLKELKIRRTTLFSRWGGEEFVILVQFAKKDQASKIANILKKDISEYPFTKVGRVTCSFGVTEVKTNDTEIDIFHRADEALYEAKEKGRNQVVVR